ncbi:protein FAM192A-like [Chenopodium quinoa]|uniref:FAM192A/Fyv6 N-terminal domain-containing protein n=1 Tax=Chenopodium quinoa TaxID=63459 RepID=A0A803KPQ7_CHEQI|nr:protein FAM192A-like [Chenopodium quinoa]
MAEDTPPPIRLMNFVSQEELDIAKSSRGERVDDGTAQRDRPLFEILKENKDKQDAEFNERFKHRPPKALDEDETEFLDKLETSRKEYERLLADEEAQQLKSFQAAVAEKSMVVHEVKEISPVSDVQEKKDITKKKSRPVQPLGMIIKAKPQKKAKVEPSREPKSRAAEKPSAEFQRHSDQQRTPSINVEKPQEQLKNSESNGVNIPDMLKSGLVSYSDESDDE